jgi:hypothetical protein
MKRPANLRSALLALLSLCVSPAMVVGADRPPPQPAAADAADANSLPQPPLITENPDGTMTIQRQRRDGGKDAESEKGVIIPPQIIVPFVPAPEAGQRD